MTASLLSCSQPKWSKDGIQTGASKIPPLCQGVLRGTHTRRGSGDLLDSCQELALPTSSCVAQATALNLSDPRLHLTGL